MIGCSKPLDGVYNGDGLGDSLKEAELVALLSRTRARDFRAGGVL